MNQSSKSRRIIAPWHTSYRVITGLLAFILTATLLTPMAAQAVTPNEPLQDAPGAIYSSSEMTGNGTVDFRLETELDFTSFEERCLYFATAWAQITNEATGETRWADRQTLENNGFSSITTFNSTGIRYPGGNLTLRLYAKQANGYDCNSPVPENSSELVPYHVETITIGWDKPEVLNVYPGEQEGYSRMMVKTMGTWLDSGAPQFMGGVALYVITDYGLPSQLVSERSPRGQHVSNGLHL